MNEYQYYEFQAIDSPLDKAARKALREISSRARITSAGFTVEHRLRLLAQADDPPADSGECMCARLFRHRIKFIITPA